MKNLAFPISFCFMTFLLTSCVAARIGVDSSYDVAGYPSYSEVAVASKSAKTSKLRSANSVMADNKSTTNRTGFYVGVFLTDISLGEKIEVQPELNFLAIKDNLNQIQAPILAKYEVIDQLSIVAGPNLGYLLDAPNGIKSFNFGVDLGAAYNLTEQIVLSARYNKGLSNLLENAPSGSSVKLNNIQVGVGYKFN